MSKIVVGQLYRKPYPFKHWEDEYSSGWAGGCHVTHEEGPEIFESYCEEITLYAADGEGEIEYEVLAFVEMPRLYLPRVLYRVTMIDPKGNHKKANKCHTVTEPKFRSWVESVGSSYPFDYEVNDNG